MALSRIGVGVVTMLLVVLGLGMGRWVVAQAVDEIVQVRDLPPDARATSVAGAGLLYGRVVTDDGTVRLGYLRFGGNEEALWSNYFNGSKKENPWAGFVPDVQRPTDRRAFELFGFELAGRDVPRDLSRPFMARFGDIARIEARGRDLTLILKSGTIVELDRFGADDFADGLTLWDGDGNAVALGEWGVRTIEFLPAPSAEGPGPAPLHGAVRTSQGTFTGLIQWDREETLSSDDLLGLPFGEIESIERTSAGSRVTLRGGETMELSGDRKVDEGNRGLFVDDSRFGRVLVSWTAFERVDFSTASEGAPGYESFVPGAPLRGAITTRAGGTFVGRLVFDLDESETTETLDAPWGGVDYTVPFAMVASIERVEGGDSTGTEPSPAAGAIVELTSGERLRLEPAGDVGPSNAGLLVFADGEGEPEYVPWTDVARIDFEVTPTG